MTSYPFPSDKPGYSRWQWLSELVLEKEYSTRNILVYSRKASLTISDREKFTEIWHIFADNMPFTRRYWVPINNHPETIKELQRKKMEQNCSQGLGKVFSSSGPTDYFLYKDTRWS